MVKDWAHDDMKVTSRISMAHVLFFGLVFYFLATGKLHRLDDWLHPRGAHRQGRE